MTAPARTAKPAPSAAARLRDAANRALRRVVGGPKADAPARMMFPPSPFAEWGYEEAEDAVMTAIEDTELDFQRAIRDGTTTPIPDQAVYQDPRQRVSLMVTNRAFFEGDHWQMGAGWIGPHPQTTDADYTTAMNELVAAFTSKNVIREVVKRHASGVIGKAPTWSFIPRRALKEGEQPTAEEATAMEEANLLVRAWWDARKVQSLLHDAVCTLLFTARAPLRLYIPAGLLDLEETGDGRVQGIVRPENIEQALNMIWPDHPTPEHAAVVQDDDTKMLAGVRLYTEQHEGDTENAPKVDAKKNGSVEDSDMIELVYLDRTGKTIIRLLDAEEAEDEEAYEFDFGARLTMMEMRRDPLISPQVAQAQRALNLALSMLPRSVITGGFLERVLLNAQMPGRFEKDSDGRQTRFIPEPLIFGPGSTNVFAGIETTDAMGNRTIATPDVKWRDPVPVDSPIAAAGRHYLDILDETSQLHVVLSGDNQVSGKSREQARAEYLNSLMDTRPECDAALRFLLETPLAMAEELAGTPGKLTTIVRVQVSCRLDTGPLSDTERAANEASIGKSLSQETAMSRNGVDDIDAELGRMSDDPLSRATLAKVQGDALTSLTTAGMSIDTAAEMLGLDPKIAAKIKKDLEEGAFNNPADPNAEKPPAGGGGGSSSRTAPPAGGQRNPKDAPQASAGASSQAGGDA